MRHLDMIDLARLVDEPANNEEQLHLSECAACRDELEALRDQTLRLSRLDDPIVPAALSHRIDRSLSEMPVPVAARKVDYGFAFRIAAGIALFLLGGTMGTFVVAPTLASAPEPAAEMVAPLDASQAALAVQTAEAEYLRALANYAQITQTGNGDPLNRLAALEGIVLTTRAALREAPADPVINNYHLTALGQREALLREIERISADDEWY